MKRDYVSRHRLLVYGVLLVLATAVELNVIAELGHWVGWQMNSLSCFINYRDHEADRQPIPMSFMRLKPPTFFIAGFCIFKNFSGLSCFELFIGGDYDFAHLGVNISSPGKPGDGAIPNEIRTRRRELNSIL